MAKKKINKGLEAARQKLTADFLESSGVPKGRDRTKLIKEIKQHADTGGMSWPEAHEEALTNWREETLAKQLKEISKINEKERKEQRKAKPKKKETPLPLEEDAYQIALKAGSEKQTAEKATNTAAISKAIREKEEKSAADGPSVARDRADAAKKNIKDRGGKPVADLIRATPLSTAIMEHGSKGKDKELTKHVLGVTDKAINFVALNPKLFEDGLEGDTATRLVEQAVDIANASLKATEENAPQLLGQLLYLEKIAIDAKDSEVAKLIKEIIGPVKESLKKKAGWKGLLKSKVKNYIGNIPKTLVEKIPVIGGFLGEMMGRNKQVKESTEQSAGAIEEGVSRGTGRGTIAAQGLRKVGKGIKEDEISGDIGGDIGGGVGGGIGGRGGRGGRGGGSNGGSGGGRGDGFGGGNGIIQILQSGFESIRIELVEIKGILKDFLVSPESKLKEKEKEFELGGKNKLDSGKKQTETKSGGKLGGFFGGIFDGLLNNIEKIGKKKTKLIDAAKAIAALGASIIPLAIALKIMKGVGLTVVGVLAGSLLTLGIAGEKIGKNKSIILKGALAIAALGASIIPLAVALQIMKGVGFETVGVLAASLLTLGVAGGILGKMSSMMLKGALAIAALGASLIPLAISLQMMKGVEWESLDLIAASLIVLGVAGGILGSMSSMMLKGAVAIAALGASLIPLAFALNLVKDVGFKSILVLAAALVTFGLAAALIGMPAVLPFILLGALGIAALGVALIPLAFALNLATPAIEAFGAVVSAVGQSISDILQSFIEFGNPIIGVGLLSAALGIGAVTVALLAFSAASAGMKIGGAAAGLVSGVMGFFTGGAPPSAIEMLALFAEFGKSAPLLEQAANAITKLADALKYFSGIKEIPTGNLEALTKVGEAASKIPASSTGSGAVGGASTTSGGGAKDNKDKAAKIESAKAKGASKTPDFNKLADESDEDIEKRIKKENPNLDDELLEMEIDAAQTDKKLAAYGLQYGSVVNGEVINPDTGTPFAFGGLGVNGALKILEDGGQPTGSMFDGVVYGKDAESNQKNESNAGQVGNQNPQSAPPSLSMASGAASESSLLSSTPTTPSTASAPSKEPVKGLFQSGRDWLTSKLFGSSETKTAETPTAIATPAPSQQQAPPKSETKTAPLQRKTSDRGTSPISIAPSTKKSSAGVDPQDINDFQLSPEDSIKSDERTANDVQNALKKRKDTGQTVAPKLTGGETREETINGQTTTRTVAPYPEYTAGTKLTEREMSLMDMQVGGGFESTNADIPGGEGYNTLSIPDIKLEQYLKQKRETISNAKSALTPNAGMITPSPNTDVGKQVAATQTARAELDAAKSANAASQSKGNTTVQTNIGGAKSNTVNVNNSGDGVRDTKSTLEVARKESR